jgi:hypothetical protein
MIATLIDDHHVDGPDRDGDGGDKPLRREHRQRGVPLPELLTDAIGRRSAAVRWCRPPFHRARLRAGVTGTSAAAAFNSP